MQVPLLLACPGCTFGAPGFYLTCMVLGGIPVTWMLLQNPVRHVKIFWGMPRITLPQIGGLLPLLLLPTIMFFVGMQKHDLQRCLFGTYGLVLCVVYLWIRLCWLMEQLGVHSAWRQMLFPGVVFPGMVAVGAVFGFSALGTLVIGSFRPAEAVVFFLVTFVVAAALYAIIALFVRSIFHECPAQLRPSGDESIIYIESLVD